MQPTPLVVYSHLRWDPAFKRPHQVMSRLAVNRPILYVEEPVANGDEPSLETTAIGRNLIVARPHFAAARARAGFGHGNQDVLANMIRGEIQRQGWQEHAAWLYTPMAIGVSQRLRPRATVYEAIANLAALPGAPTDLGDREQELLQCADVVMTGGPTLYRALHDRHPFVRCFPSSVDSMHFERRPWIEDPCDQDELPHPRLGYFGAIDDRLDLGLLDTLASAHPDWQIVLLGPILRIAPEALPSRPNLHVLGGRGYAELPAYAAWWDLGLIPYVLNPLTRSINPSQTLEYLAADLPVVTTPIDDVVELYGDLVQTGDTHESFLAACESALSASQSEKARRRSLVRAALHKTSWDDTVHRMDDILRYVADTQSDGVATPRVAAFQGARL